MVVPDEIVGELLVPPNIESLRITGRGGATLLALGEGSRFEYATSDLESIPVDGVEVCGENRCDTAWSRGCEVGVCVG